MTAKPPDVEFNPLYRAAFCADLALNGTHTVLKVKGTIFSIKGIAK